MREQSQKTTIITRPLKLLFVGDTSIDKTKPQSSEIVNGFYCDLNNQVLDEDLYPPVSDTAACSGEKEQKIVRIITCNGLQDYLLKMNSLSPDYVFIVIDPKNGISPIIKEYLGIALTLHRPISLLISRTELTTITQYEMTLKAVEGIVEKVMKKQPIILQRDDPEFNMTKIARKIKEGATIPIVTINYATKEGLKILKKLMCVLENSSEIIKENLPCEIWIKTAWCVSEGEIVCEGVVKTGKLALRKYLRLGPVNGKFFTILVNKISTHEDSVKSAISGENVIIKGIVINEGRLIPGVVSKNSGLIAVEKLDKKCVIKSFDAEIAMLKRECVESGKTLTIVSRNACENITVENIIEKEALTQGDRGIIKCNLDSMEYLKVGDKVFFMTDAVIAMGIISKTYP